MEKFYLTTAIAYVNDQPHLGHALQFIRADVLARFFRKENKDVFFLTGTDEYGSKIFNTAKEKNISPEELVNKNVFLFQKIDKELSISYDFFIRTTDKKNHWPAVKKIWKILKANGDIYQSTYQGFYCSGCEAYLLEKELINGQCPIHKKKPEYIKEKNYFFRLSKYQKKLIEIIEQDKIEIIPQERKNEVLNIIKSGLNDVSFSRLKKRLPWGIEVPDDRTQVIYVWCDALINYLSGIGYASDFDKFRKYWPADLHIFGKDNLKFHAIYWPAMLLSANLPLPKKLLVHGFITSKGEKMSKSLGNIVNPMVLLEKYQADLIRFYLLKEMPAFDDGDFTEEKLKAVYQGDLVNGLGNFVSRITNLLKKPTKKTNLRKDFQAEIEKTKILVKKNIEKFYFSEAIKNLFKLISFGDKQLSKLAPWKQTNKLKQETIFNFAFLLKELADELSIFLPQTAEKIINNFKEDKNFISVKDKLILFKKYE